MSHLNTLEVPVRRWRHHVSQIGWLSVVGAVLGGLAGCASAPPVPLRPQPTAYADTVRIPEPQERGSRETRRILNNAIGDEINHAFSLSTHEAVNITHFDDVVNSAWFEHRNDLGEMSPEDIWRGPSTVTGPDTSRVLTVVAGKAQGISPGFTVRDARGDTYIVKFDPSGFLHLSSAAGVIANRLLYGAGYHVPEDYILVFDRHQVVVDPEATITGVDFIERPMVQADIDVILDRVDALPNGLNLAIASKFVPGIPKGPFYFESRRKDDPNDYYHHQYRRDLRGLYVVASWINHVDMRFANTLDAYVEPGYLRHYLIDFAAALGSGTKRSHSPREGSEYNFDFWPSMGRIFTLGFYRMGWEETPFEVIDPSIGWMPREDFDPEHWKPNWPNKAFRSVTARDGYWGAKLVGSFSDAQIEAAVRAGELPRAAASAALVDLLVYRRDRVLEYWYAQVTPIENVQATAVTDGGFELSFEDLGIDESVWSAGETRYEFRFRHDARSIDRSGRQAATPGADRQSIQIQLNGVRSESAISPSDSPSRATLEITAVRSRAEDRSATVHLVWEGDENGYEVVALEH